MVSFFQNRQKKCEVPKTVVKKTRTTAGRFERLPKTLNELDASYRVMLRELAKR